MPVPASSASSSRLGAGVRTRASDSLNLNPTRSTIRRTRVRDTGSDRDRDFSTSTPSNSLCGAPATPASLRTFTLASHGPASSPRPVSALLVSEPLLQRHPGPRVAVVGSDQVDAVDL